MNCISLPFYFIFLFTKKNAVAFDGVGVCGDSDPCRARSQCSFYKRVECFFIKHRKVGGYLPIIVSRGKRACTREGI